VILTENSPADRQGFLDPAKQASGCAWMTRKPEAISPILAS
jgi:hypothetical protein